jgi:hypothetical protein
VEIKTNQIMGETKTKTETSTMMMMTRVGEVVIDEMKKGIV